MHNLYNARVASRHHPSNKMYSSYGNQRRNANVLRFTPPGFRYPIDVQFPPRCLPVCERCKKNFKTREHCRGRDCHTDLAWCETYVCVSLDNSCTGEDGRLLDGPFVAKVVPPIAFNLKGDLNPLTPICAPCKDKNYTRTYCRQNKKHRQLPWSTVYVIVSLKPGVFPERSASAVNTSGSGNSNKRRKDNNGDTIRDGKEDDEELKHKASGGDTESSEGKDKDADDSSKELPSQTTGAGDKEKDQQKKKSKEDDLSEVDDKEKDENGSKKSGDTKEEELDFEALYAIEAKKLEDIPRSRTFLATVSSKINRIEWVDIDPMLETQLPIMNENNDSAAQDAYDRRSGNPMMHHTMQRTMGNIDANSMNPGMNNMDMRMNLGGRMRGMNGGNGMNMNMSMSMNPMGGFGNMPAMNVPSSAVFGDDPRTSMDPQMMSNSMNRYGAQDVVSHADMRHMDMRSMRMQGHMGGAVPFDTPSMPSRMGYGGSSGFTQQEIMQYEAMRNREAQAQMGFDRQNMMNSMPFNTVSGSFAGDMPMDRMPPTGGMAGPEMMGRVSRSGMGGSDMIMNSGSMDMMPMNRSGAGQDMMRHPAFERMSRGSMGAPDMMGLYRAGMGMGGQGDRPPQNWREMGEQGAATGLQASNVAGGYDNPDAGHQDNKKQGSDNNESGI